MYPQDRIKEANPRAIILSGGPNSVHIEGAPRVPAGFFEYCQSNQIPVLGICYGMQLMVQQLGGVVHQAADGGEYGRMVIRASGGSQLYAYDSSEHGVHKESVWMSHGDSIDKLPEGFQPVATSEQVTLQLPQHASASSKQATMNSCWQSATKDLKHRNTVRLVLRYACNTRC